MKAVYANKLRAGDKIIRNGREKTVIEVSMVPYGGWQIHCTDGTGIKVGRYEKVVRL